MNNIGKFLMLGLVFSVCGFVFVYSFPEEIVVDDLDDFISNHNPDKSWVKVAEVKLSALGEYNPGTNTSSWLSSFILDYAETPGTCLVTNATNGAYNGWGNVSGYVDGDNQETDLKANDPGYVVVRCRFNTTVATAGAFNAGYCRCNLTLSGDETVADVSIDGDDTNIAGGGRACISHNVSGEQYIYINFVWDDGADGYRITADGTINWSITIWAYY